MGPLVERMSAAAGVLSAANASASRSRQQAAGAVRSRSVSSGPGTRATHQARPSGSAVWPRNARLPWIMS
jgi:hypothetical protein